MLQQLVAGNFAIRVDCYYSFLHHCLLSCHYVLFQKKFFLSKSIWGEQAAIGGEAALPA